MAGVCSYCNTEACVLHFFGERSLCNSCMVLCGRCQTVIPLVGSAISGSSHICPSCADSHFVRCVRCDRLESRESIIQDSRGTYLCRQCTHYYSVCDGCDCYFDQESTHTESGFIYCAECYDVFASPCDDCRAPVPRRYLNITRQGLSVCDRCFNIRHRNDRDRQDLERNKLHPHSFKPIPFFFPEERYRALYLGVELEVDNGNNILSDAYEVGTSHHPHIYVKKDSSLNNGFEIVTHPMTLTYHLEVFPWDKLCEQVVSLGYSSHDTATCGLHIHMSRDAFLKDAIMKLLFIIERFWDKWVTFSRRTPESLERWAARYGGGDTPQSIYNNALLERTKYKAVNLINSDTIEIRLFRGTLNPNTIKAALQLCAHLHHLSNTVSKQNIMALTWADVINSISYKELLDYLDLTGLSAHSVALPIHDK